jgi:hypothetical protein
VSFKLQQQQQQQQEQQVQQQWKKKQLASAFIASVDVVQRSWWCLVSG